jgi:hypothetical protein
MAGRVTLVQDGYAIRGLLPPALRLAPDSLKLTFWSFVVAEGLKEKDRELARGLDAEGRPLKPISAETRRHRRSAMTPTGKGDPSAPPLTPGRALSRTRSLLAGRAFPDRAEFWWRYDAFTYDSWARILRDQKRKGRDVFGLSPAGLARVAARSWQAFARQQAGKPGAAAVPPVVQPAAAPAPQVLPVVGTTSMKYATAGIGAAPHAPGAETTGGLPWEKWLAYLRKPAPPPAGMVPTRRPFNTLLSMIFGPTTRPSPPPPPKLKPKPMPAPKGAVPLRKPRPIPVAAAPLPTPTPTPVPAAGPKPKPRPRPAFDWSKAVDEDLPALAAHRDAVRKMSESTWTRGGWSDAGPEGDIPGAEVEERFAAGLKSTLAAAEPYTRVDPEALSRILGSGRFKSQFETGQAKGVYDPAERARVEARIMGVRRTIADAKRPIYGYAGEPGFGGFRTQGEPLLDGYGEVAIRFKPGAMGRATVTIGDSLNREEQIVATRVSAPTGDSLPAAPEGVQRALPVIHAMIRRPEETLANLRLMQEQYRYVELQFHGGMGLDDIAEVAFPRAPAPELARLLDSKDIPWRVIDRP